MKRTAMIVPILILILWLWLALTDGLAANTSSALAKAKQEAEPKGYIFFTNHNEIVDKAKVEGKLRVLTALGGSLRATTEAFKRRYPFIDIQTETATGADLNQKHLLEVQANVVNWDTVRPPTGFYRELLPYLWKVDFLGMAEHGVLDIPLQMIDPKNRNIIALGSRFAVVAYNKNLISPDRAPKTWEDMLTPEWKERKLGVDIEPSELTAFVPAWGLEKTVDYARKLAAQQPIWSRGTTRTLAAVASGEIPLFVAANYYQTRRYQKKDAFGVIQYSILEPIPVKVAVEQGILAKSKNPHAASLWLEFMASTEAQKLIDQHEPLQASLYRKGSVVEQELRGKKLSVVSWEENEKMEQWIAKIVEAFGFPRAETK